MVPAGSDEQHRRRRFVDPTVPILLLTLVVHVVRRNIFDVVMFAGTVALIGIDRRWPLPRLRSGRALAPRWFVVGSVLVFGAVVGLFAVGSWPVQAALALPGVLALVVVAGSRPRPAAPRDDAGTRTPTTIGWVVWPGLLVLAALLELSSFLQQPDPQTGSYRHPTLSTLIEPLLASPVFRMVMLTVWAAAGWWLVRTCRRAATGAGRGDE